jgi:hypothetical protein
MPEKLNNENCTKAMMLGAVEYRPEIDDNATKLESRLRSVVLYLRVGCLSDN